ncbi:hypothetical protein GCM10011374_01990 [Kocuria dechangensis]|uniref:Aminoglycoside phosphotransferase domain-containing protein n=1 Tax=Kocuria dechangensis TaxID=1176249 RepID=A0A917GFG1_9MICC|nr:aminoglycoside phosphotransferase family protein [Kocuria dechangensis]GGG43240.1 hypothetical protein GCM10011374_01990 [Kocuria dechangensis]
MDGPSREAAAVGLLTGPDAGTLLRRALRPAGLAVHRWTLRRVHHRPGAGATAIYDVAALAGARRAAETVCVSTVPVPLLSPAPVVRLRHRDLELVAWRHPHDPWLPGLPWASSPGHVGRAVFGSGEPAALTTLSYRPGRRAVVRAVLGSEVRYLKVLRAGRAEGLVDRHRLLLGAGLPVPEPVGALVDDVVVLRALPGAPPPVAARDGDAAALLPAHVLALLDALPAQVLALPARPAWTDRVLDYGRAAAVALPEEADRIRELARAVDEARAATGPGPVVPVHGDLHEANLLVTPGTEGPFGPVTGLLDVETAGPGHRVDDLACLAGHLAVLPAGSARTAATARRMLAGFDEAVDPTALRVRAAGVALSLVAGARRSGGPPDRARQRLAVAERLLAEARAR